MARRRKAQESEEKGGDDSLSEDDFIRKAKEDRDEYLKEVEAEQKAREEAKKADRRYTKKAKKEKVLPEDESDLFDKLTKRLDLKTVLARKIQSASIKTLRQNTHSKRGNAAVLFGEASRSSEESTQEGDEQEETSMSITEQSRKAKEVEQYGRTPGQVEVSHNINASSDSESEEELVLMTLPQPHKAKLEISSAISSAKSSPTEPPLLNLEKDEPATSSEEEFINLSVVPKIFGVGSKTEPSSQRLSTTDSSGIRTVGSIEITSTSGITNDTTSEGAFRPAFSLSPQQLATGPLILEDSVKVPAPINRFLRDYQREGVSFLYENYKRKQGGLLGDDMGLGKTIQVIAFLSAIMKKQGLESTDENRRIKSVRAGRVSAQGQQSNQNWPTCLIICPNSVQTNWQNELDIWGYFEHDLLNEDSLKDFQRGRLDILITSHQKAKGWIDRLNMQSWTVVFVDECHMLKNPNSGMTKTLNSLKCSSRFGLTGTAIQNRFEEFWTLLDWCNPGEFGSLRHWQQVVAEPIRRGQSAMATMDELAHARLIAESLKEKLLPPCFLRRTKDLIKSQLPNKRDNIVFCPLTPLQISSYKKILDEPEVLMIRLAKDPCDCGAIDEDGLPYMRCKCCHQTDDEGRPWNYHMLKYIMLLQRCSNHLALVFPDPHDNITISPSSPLIDEMRKHRFLRQTEIVQQMFPDSWQTKTNNKTNGFRAEYCGKWLVLRRLMQEWKIQGDKVLLFSMNLRLLDWLSYFVEMEGYRHLRLDGGTPQKKRQPLVNQFNHDPLLFVFLISTTAGGTGLNLTGANKVVVFDPHWNPAHDLQAMDRAYRFGQTRDVDVYRLIGRGSLEETIYDRQLYKQQMGRIGYDASEERRYFQPGDEQGFPRLFQLRDTGSVTRDMIQACDLTEATFALQHIVNDAEVDKIKAEEVKADWDALLATQRDLENASTSSAAAAPPPPPAEDSIARVLQMSGIEYTHVNDSLLGGSKVESIISKQAKANLSKITKRVNDERNTILAASAPRRPKAEHSSTPRVKAWPPIRSTSSKLSWS